MTATPRRPRTPDPGVRTATLDLAALPMPYGASVVSIEPDDDGVAVTSRGPVDRPGRRYRGVAILRQRFDAELVPGPTQVEVLDSAPGPECRPPLPAVWCGPDAVVRMASEMTMECTDLDGTPRWRLRLFQWLHTPVEFRGDRIWFGTAGRGGRFYGVDLGTGAVVVDVDTGGTVDYRWWGPDHVVLPDPDILILDVRSGDRRRLRLGPLEIRDAHTMLLDGDVLYASAFRRRGDRLAPWIVRAALS